MNNNLAGSFAPSSLRGDRKTLFYDDGGNLRFSAPGKACDVLLKGKDELALPCWALAGFLFRNALFEGPDGHPSIGDLTACFKGFFHIDETDNPDFAHVFDAACPDYEGRVFDVVEMPEEADVQVSALTIIDDSFRTLDSEDLGIDVRAEDADVEAGFLHGSAFAALSGIEKTIIRALDAYSGVILSGAPGTSKSYYAEKVAKTLTGGDYERMRFTQFHASYQFEDFIQGYIPDPDRTSFRKKDGIFLSLCNDAAENLDQVYVIVIDELSRSDSCRVFGEALTYIEKTKRGKYFYLPSGDQMQVPPNVYILATMNPIDRGADEVDVAFGRRFATIDMEPSPSLLRERLEANGFDRVVLGKLLEWFAHANNVCKRLQVAGIGHAYFWNVRDAETLSMAWECQVVHHLRRSFGLRHTEREELENRMMDILK